MDKPTPVKYMHEVLAEVCALETREEREKALKEKAFKQVKTILQLQYNDKIELDLPKGTPPFKRCPEGREPSPVANVFKVIGMLVPSNTSIPRIKKEKIFIGMLEQLHPEDAKLLCAVKDGNLLSTRGKRYSKITKSLVQAVFPEIL